MTTIAARIVRVLNGPAAPTMLHAIDEDGLELRLEVPSAHARMVVPGQVLVVQWSAHAVPDLASPPETPRHAIPTDDPIDHEFDIRSDTATPTARDIEDELSTLLGPARRKG